tara:strand:- start:3993 stop:5255 length:1263 start_codon:yes stop_codon:yes gene_type:complete
MLTGTEPDEHGIVGNGWYFRDLDEIAFWKQSNELVRGEKIWQSLSRKYPGFRTSNLFWWYNMNTTVDYSITPKPHYGADGRKEFDVFSHPAFHKDLEKKIGKFPFFTFWGPRSGIEASQWIANCAVEEFRMHRPNLQLVYLPHLDYNLQKLGPAHPAIRNDLRQIDAVVGELVHRLSQQGCDSMLVSEYGISPVYGSISINQELRKAGLLSVRESLKTEILDTGTSEAFAVADHQVAHVYVRNRSRIKEVQGLLQRMEGVDSVLDSRGMKAKGLTGGQSSSRALDSKRSSIASDRAGDLVAVARPGMWFNYYYWLDEQKAPDFARTVDIHRKPGYDPVELFTDPALRFLPVRVAWKVMKKKLGFRMLMDVIPLRPELVKGSHGRLNELYKGPMIIGASHHRGKLPSRLTDVYSVIQRYFN